MAHHSKQETVTVFTTNERLQEVANAILAHADTLSRGDTLLYADMERLSGLRRYISPQWSALVRKVKRALLRDRKIALLPIRSVGYRFCLPEEQVNVIADMRLKKSSRQLTRTISEVGAVPASELTVHQQRTQTFRVDSTKQVRSALRRASKDQKNAASPTPTLPRRMREPVAVTAE